MKISKIRALVSLLFGGWAGIATYILECINRWLDTLDKSKFAEVAQIVTAVNSALKILLNTFLPAKYRNAAAKTVDTLDGLASALADGEVTQEELDHQIDLIESAISAWKEVK